MPAIDPPPDGLRASDLIGRHVVDADGRPLGRVADLVVEDTTVVAVIVTGGLWGRLLGYERESAHGPWLLETLARAVVRRDSRRIAWADVVWAPSEEPGRKTP